MNIMKRAAVAATIAAVATLGAGATQAQAADQCVVMKRCSHDTHPGTWGKRTVKTTADPLVLWLRWRYNR